MSGLTAVILAAGKGARLSPLTDHTNKVLLEIGGRSILTRLLQGLSDAGVAAVTIVTGHCADAVEQHVGASFGDLPVSYVHNPNYGSSNNIVSLACALATLPTGTPILLVEGDLLLDPALIARMAAGSDIALLAPVCPGLDGTLATVAGAQITGLIMGDELAALTDRGRFFKTVNVTTLSADTLDRVFRAALTARLQSGGHDDYYEAVLADLLADGRIRLGAVIVGDEPWAEIDDAQDLDRARYLFVPEHRRATLDRAFGGFWNYPVLDYAYPQNCHFPTSAIRQELSARLPEVLGRYGSTQQILDEKLARYVGASVRELVLLNGLSQIFPWLAARYGDAKALLPRPSFGEFSRIWPDADSYADHGSIDMATVVDAASDATLIVFVNPNNPTGGAVSSEAIVAFARANPAKTIIVDESFADFSDRPDVRAMSDGTLPSNVLLLKSLGKALGISGLRLGYVQSSAPELIADIRQWLPIWNCNALAEVFLELLPKHRRALAAALDCTRHDREEMRAKLETLPDVAQVLPSEANFLLVRLAIARDTLGGYLDRLVEQHGIYLKDVSGRIEPAGAWVRVSVRTAADNERLYAALDAASDRPAPTSPAIQR